jgi:cardiolipin synthase
MEYAISIGLYFAFVIGVCLHIIKNVDTPSKAMAYIGLVIILPIAGAFIYFSIGFNYRKNKLYQKKINLNADSAIEFSKATREYGLPILEEFTESLNYFKPLASFLNNQCLTTAQNDIKLLINGEAKFPTVFEELKKATHHIHIEYYIIEDDDIAQQLADILIEKVKEGVEVRLMYDDFGSNGIRRKYANKLKINGVKVFPFFRINHVYFANRLNYRNHRKIIVIDGKVGFVGGINFSDRYINTVQSKLFWRDTHVMIKGHSIMNLQFIFMTDWNFCSNENLEFSRLYFPNQYLLGQTKNKIIQVAASGPDSDHPNILYALIQSIILSRKEVLITTPYFIPDESLFNAILITKASGATVKILVPGISDSIIVNKVSSSYYGDLLKAGVEVYRYTKGFVHAKTMVCDEHVSFIGTANLDHRSFDLNFEVNAIFYDRELANELKSNFIIDIANAEKLDLIKWNQRSIFIKFTERFFRLISPLV